MEKFNIILEDGNQKEVDSIFYLYNSKYYFIYTERKLDENGYVILHVVQVGKEVNNTPNGPVDTGYMIGVDINNPEESESVQKSITTIVEDRKNGTASTDIQYLPLNMLTNLKVVSKKTFRLLRTIVEQYFGLSFDSSDGNQSDSNQFVVEPVNEINAVSQSNFASTSQNNFEEPIQSSVIPNTDSNLSNNILSSNLPGDTQEQNNDVIIDYRSRFFEEQQKNKDLEQRVQELMAKLNNIKQIVE